MASRAAILALALAAFGSSLWSPFFFDDHALASDPAVTRPGGLAELLSPERTRPLTYATFWLNYRLAGFEPLGYHLTNLALFAGIAWLAGGLFRRLEADPAASLALVVFALHPLQTEAVVYVFARATLLATLFCLLSWRAWLDGRRWRATLWFAAALLAKEEAAAFPVFLAGWEWFCHHRRESWRQLLPALFTMLGLVAVAAARLLYATQTIAGSGAGLDLGAITPWTYLMTQGRAIWLYLRLFVAPYGQNFDRDFRLSATLDLETACAWAALLVLGCAALWISRKWKPAWWLAGALLLLAPTSSFAPLADLTAERRMFLPMLSLALFGGAALAATAGRRAGPIGAVLAVALAALSWNRTQVFTSEHALWSDAVAKSPEKVRPKLQLARAVGLQETPGRPRQLELLNQARQLAPDDPEVLGEIGVYHLQGAEAGPAAQVFRQAIELDPENAQLHTNLGAALALRGRAGEGERSFRQALRLDPCNFDARNNLMLVLLRRGAADQARELADAPPDCPFSQQQRDALDLAR